MLKVVVYGCDYGAELFADRLEAELPVIEVIRVINWRPNEPTRQRFAKLRARKLAEKTLRPYIGKVDLIIFADLFLSTTSLKYFNHKYNPKLRPPRKKHTARRQLLRRLYRWRTFRHLHWQLHKNYTYRRPTSTPKAPRQKFIGMDPPYPGTFIRRKILILTTSSLVHTKKFRTYLFKLSLGLHRRHIIVSLDQLPAAIDHGKSYAELLEEALWPYRVSDFAFDDPMGTPAKKLSRQLEVILAHQSFSVLSPDLRKLFGANLKIHDSFRDTILKTYHVLGIRGYDSKRKK